MVFSAGRDALLHCVLFGAVFACSATAQPALLDIHRPIEREIGPGKSDVFAVQASAGQVIHVVVRKKTVAVALNVFDAAGKTVLAADPPGGTYGIAPASWIARESGTFLVKVSKTERTSETGRYEIELLELRELSDKDSARIQAQEKLYAAAAKERAADRESRTAAIELYKDAASSWHAVDDSYQEALCQERIGALTFALGDYQKALEFYERASSLHRARGDSSSEAATVTGTVSIYLGLGELDRALAAAERALALRRTTGDRGGEATAFYNLAIVQYQLGEAQKAVDTFQQSLLLRRELKDVTGESLVLAALADRYRDFGAEEKALDYYQQSLTLARGAGNRGLESKSLMGMGDVYFFIGEKQKGLDAYQQSLAVNHALGDRSGEALALIGIGNIYSNLAGRLKPADAPSAIERRKALEYYEESLQTGRAAGDYAVQVFALMGAGVAYSAQGDKQKAFNYLNQALFMFGFVRLPAGEGWARYEIARVERDRGNLTQARTLAAASREAAESLRSKVLSQDLRATFLAAVHDCYGLEIDILMRLHAADPSRDYQAAALAISERARARVLLDNLSEARADIREGVDPVLLERERTIQTQLNAKDMARLQMLASPHTPEMGRRIENEVRDLAAQYENVRTQIRAGSPHYAALHFPEPLTLKDIQSGVLDSETILLEYALGQERSFLWAVSPDSIASIILPGKTEIEAAARRFHTALLDPASSSLEAGKTLSRMLLGEVAPMLGHRRLLIVAEGVLQYLPFSALPDPGGAGNPLVVNHEIVNIPSASTLAVLRREYSNRPTPPKTLAIFADPVFSATDSRITRQQAAAAASRASRTQRSQGDPGITGFRLPRLPGTRREAAAIAALVPENSRKQAVDFDANRATLTDPEIAQYRILHLATHGLLNTEHPELSGIVLSLVDSRGGQQDGFLRLNEIYNLKLQAGLVVLSACQTALGKEIQGEGLVSLTRGFMYAGSPRVLASLWKVDDRATAELMKRFYSTMLRPSGANPSAALRAAQIEMSKTAGWEHPYYWAAFTLQGEWR